MTCARSVAMDTSVGIVLLCVFYISIVDAQDSFDDGDNQKIIKFVRKLSRSSGDHQGYYQKIIEFVRRLSGNPDYQYDQDEGDHQGVLDLLTSRDCECTPNGTFLPDAIVAYDRKIRPKLHPIFQIECSTINLNPSEFLYAVEEYNYSPPNTSMFPVAYCLDCRRYVFKQVPCVTLFSMYNLRFLSLNGCSLSFLFVSMWTYLEVLEIVDDVGLVVDMAVNDAYEVAREEIVTYMFLSFFRWCPGKSNPLLTEEEIFPSMPVLQIFNAARCGLARFPFGGGFIRTLKRSSKLELITLSHNNIKFLEVFNTSELKSPHLTLDFSHNEIQNVTSAQLELLVGRESMYVNLSHNFITDIDILDSYTFTQTNVTIDLSNNKITTFNQADFEHLINATSTLVNLQNNQLDCNCRMSFLWEISLLGNYTYLWSEKCASPKQFAGKYLYQLTLSDICQNNDGSNPEYVYLKLETAIILMTLVLVITVIISVLMFKYRTEMRVVIYTKCGLVLPCETSEYEYNKRYDAFVAYSSCDEDLAWVIGTLFPMLTEDGNDFRICLHHKDFVPGKSIAENISDAIEWSRFTILVLSRNFLRSEWCIYEFRSAFDQSIQERKQHMIFILMEEITDDQMDSDLRKCLHIYTYIKADDVLLRDRMTYALSDKRRGRGDRARRGTRRRMLGVQPRLDDGQAAAAANIIQEAETVL